MMVVSSWGPFRRVVPLCRLDPPTWRNGLSFVFFQPLQTTIVCQVDEWSPAGSWSTPLHSGNPGIINWLTNRGCQFGGGVKPLLEGPRPPINKRFINLDHPQIQDGVQSPQNRYPPGKNGMYTGPLHYWLITSWLNPGSPLTRRWFPVPPNHYPNCGKLG